MAAGFIRPPKQTGQMLLNLLEHTIPVSELGLAHQGHGAIPRRITAATHPAEISVVLKQRPHRNIKSTSKMSHSRVHTDHQVELADQTSGVEKIPDLLGMIHHAALGTPRIELVGIVPT